MSDVVVPHLHPVKSPQPSLAKQTVKLLQQVVIHRQPAADGRLCAKVLQQIWVNKYLTLA